jgi:hypothetical protein
MVLFVGVAMGVIGALSGPLQADAVIYEPFADSNPSLNGNTPGLGLTGTWSATSTFTVGAGSLVYGAKATSGNQVIYGDDGATSFGNAACSVGIGSGLANAGLLNNGATLWFSVIVNTPTLAGSNPDTGFAIATNQLGSGNNLPIGAGGQAIGWTIKNGKLQASTWNGGEVVRGTNGPAVATNATIFVVGEITWGADSAAADAINLYLPDTDLNLGSVRASTSAVLNEANFDTITSSLKSNTGYGFDEIRFGATYEDVRGPIPILTLRVDPVTGATALVGHSAGAVSLDYYQITSPAGSLDAADWVSLADQDFEGHGPANGSGNGWEEAGGAGKSALAEAYLLGSSTIGASQSVSLGKGYDAGVGAEDLVFKYRTDSGKIIEGLVEYVTSAVPGDANLDGVVDAADYIALKEGFGTASGARYRDGDFDLDGDVDWDDLAILQGSFGQGTGGAAAVPEPAALSLMGAGGLALLRRRRNARPEAGAAGLGMQGRRTRLTSKPDSQDSPGDCNRRKDS